MNPPKVFTKGEKITCKVAGRTATGIVGMASDNGRSLFLLFDEGIPAPFGLLGTKQAIAAFWEDGWRDILSGREIELS